MSDSEGVGILWLAAIGLGLWGWSTHDKLTKERSERIEAVSSAQMRVDKVELRLIEMERKLEFAEGDIKSAFEAQDRLRKVVNTNADIENRQAVREMTARGACGTETIQYPNGGWSVRNKECTLKDLK